MRTLGSEENIASPTAGHGEIGNIGSSRDWVTCGFSSGIASSRRDVRLSIRGLEKFPVRIVGGAGKIRLQLRSIYDSVKKRR